MNITAATLYTAILISAVSTSLRAETALAELEGAGRAAELTLPIPVIDTADFQRLTPEEAAKRLPLFDYRKTDVLSVTRGAQVSHGKYSVETIEMRINDPLGQVGEFTQVFTVYRTDRPGPRPTVLISPPFIPQKIDTLSARHFTRKGYNAVVITPFESLTDTSRPLDKVDDMLIRYTITLRMCIDLLETMPEMDSGKIYAYGISMGGIRTSLAFGVEPRIRKAAEIVGGGDIPGIIADTRFKLLEELRDTRMKIEGIATVEDFRVYMKKVMTVDPLDFGVLRNPEDIYLVLGRGDKFVRYPYQEKLFHSFSRPAEGRYPEAKRSIVGHIPTAAKFNRYINLFVEFFER